MSNPNQPPYGPPAPQQTYPPPPPKKKRTGLIVLLVIVGLIVLAVLGSCVAGLASLGEPSGSTVQEAEPTASEEVGDEGTEPTEAPEPSPTTYTPKKSDWTLKIKTTDKQCFGSAGCNVSVKVTPQYKGAGGIASLPDEGTIDITYKLTGDESGPITGTSTVELSDKTVTSEEESLSTRSSGTKVKAAVTDVEYSES